MARRHSTANIDPHPTRGQEHPEQGPNNSSEWWEANRAHSPQLCPESYHFNVEDRRGSAPDYLFQPSGSYTAPPNSFSQYTPTSQPPTLGASQDLPTAVHQDAQAETLPHRRASYCIDPTQIEQSLSNRNTSIRGDHDLGQQQSRPPPPAALELSLSNFSLRHITRFEDVTYSTSPPPVSPPLSSPQDSTSPTGSDGSHGGLATCKLDEPGCYILVPPDSEEASSPAQGNRGRGLRKAMSARKPSKKPADESERYAIKMNRKFGVCIRCKISKEKCRGGIPCDRCCELKAWKTICVPAQFQQKAVFSRDIYQDRVVSLVGNIRIWDAEMPGSVPSGGENFEAHNGYSPTLQLKAYRFVPHDATLLEHIVWRVADNPDFKRLPSTSYGLKDEVPAAIFDDYLDKHVQCVIDEELKPSGDDHPILASTMRAAQEYAKGNKNLSAVVQKALRIWVAQTFFFRRAWRLCGTNTLGMQPIDVPDRSHGLIPLPRLINQQLDAQLEFRVATIEKELLAELQKQILEHNSTDWFGIFLTIYVHLSSLERDTWSLNTWEHDGPTLQEQVRQLNFQNTQPDSSKSFLWPLGVSPSTLIGKNTILADMLVLHFRAVSRGIVPFPPDCDQNQATKMTGNEKEAIEYMLAMSQQVSTLEQYLAARKAALYSRDDYNSLIGKFTTKLMISNKD